MVNVTSDDKCQECGMPVKIGDYHPYTACLMFKGCHDSDAVTKNLSAIRRDWYDAGVKYGKQQLESDIAVLRDVVNEQADDEGLWFIAQTAPEEYLQAALRRLHEVIEGKTSE